jgi:hypothetical protein
MLGNRMRKPFQIAITEPEAELPPYLESFLAHLRLLVGVPFEYLVPEPRMLPPESIRFFYLDRSWTDRLVDGAIAVGKVGTREQAHHQAHASAVTQRLDVTERIVRPLQKGAGSFENLRSKVPIDPADLVTGFLLRSSAVSGWPHMEIRAYRKLIPELHRKPAFDPGDPKVKAQQMRTLRLERLSPAVMIALFEGEPELVVLEEPHHGVQFGVNHVRGGLAIDVHNANGEQISVTTAGHSEPASLPVRYRKGGRNVLAVADLHLRLHQDRAVRPEIPPQTGGGSFALQVLDPPWRQHFEGTEDHTEVGTGSNRQVLVSIAVRVQDTNVQSSYLRLIAINQ